MKRILVVALCLLLGLMTAACGNSGAPADQGSSAPAAPAAGSDAGSSGGTGISGDTPETYPWNDFQQMIAGEYFKGVNFMADYQSRADIVKGLPVEQKGGIRIGMVAAALANPYFVTLEQAAAAQAESYGYEFVSVSYDQETTKMVSAIEDFVTQGVDAIILDPMDMNSASLAVAAAAEQGIVTIAVGQPMPADSSVLTAIYPYYYGIAFENAANLARDCFDPETRIVAGYIMIVPTWHSWGNAYIAGLYYTRMEQLGTPVTKEEAMIKGYEYYLEFFDKGEVDIPEANIFFGGYVGDGGQNEAGAMVAAETLITSIPDLNLLLPINDFQAAGAIMALEANGLVPGEDVFITVSNDGSTQALEMVRDGKLYATSNSAPELMGSAAIDLLHMVFEQGYDANDLCVNSIMPIVPLDASNWEEYYVPDTIFAKKPDVPVEFKTTQQAFEELLAAQ